MLDVLPCPGKSGSFAFSKVPLAGTFCVDHIWIIRFFFKHIHNTISLKYYERFCNEESPKCDFHFPTNKESG